MLKGDFDLLVLGHKLATSPFFEKESIPFVEISAHPLKKRGFLRASWRGFWQAIREARNFSPDIVVGFGSFHVFPVLLAALILEKKNSPLRSELLSWQSQSPLLPVCHSHRIPISSFFKKGGSGPASPVERGGKEGGSTKNFLETIMDSAQSRRRFLSSADLKGPHFSMRVRRLQSGQCGRSFRSSI